jgi:hypothetical protein
MHSNQRQQLQHIGGLRKQDWQWRTPFRTETICFDDLTAKEAIFMQLDESLQNIRKFEKDLMEKLQ